MYKIQANISGTRTIDVSDSHLATIEKYSLFENLIDSNGIIDENVLDKLKFNVRALLESEAGSSKELLDLCLNVIYNQNMKAFGLNNLVLQFTEWKKNSKDTEKEDTNICNE